MFQPEPQEPASLLHTAQQPEPKPSIASSSYRLVPIPVAYLDRVWPEVVGFVDAAARENAHLISAEVYRQRIAEREMQLWAIRADKRTAGAIVTEIYRTEAGKTCGIPIVGGDRMADWLHLLSVVKAWARENGCTRMEGNGRAGWERVLKRHGWRTISTTVALEL